MLVLEKTNLDPRRSGNTRRILSRTRATSTAGNPSRPTLRNDLHPVIIIKPPPVHPVCADFSFRFDLPFLPAGVEADDFRINYRGFYIIKLAVIKPALTSIWTLWSICSYSARILPKPACKLMTSSLSFRKIVRL